MVQCTSCGKLIDKLPSWLIDTKVTFVCNNCPNRSVKNIAFVSLEVEPKVVSADLDPEEPEEDDVDPTE